MFLLLVSTWAFAIHSLCLFPLSHPLGLPQAKFCLIQNLGQKTNKTKQITNKTKHKHKQNKHKTNTKQTQNKHKTNTKQTQTQTQNKHKHKHKQNNEQARQQDAGAAVPATTAEPASQHNSEQNDVKKSKYEKKANDGNRCTWTPNTTEPSPHHHEPSYVGGWLFGCLLAWLVDAHLRSLLSIDVLNHPFVPLFWITLATLLWFESIISPKKMALNAKFVSLLGFFFLIIIQTTIRWLI